MNLLKEELADYITGLTIKIHSIHYIYFHINYRTKNCLNFPVIPINLN